MAWQRGQRDNPKGLIASWDRRLRVRVLLWRRFGSGIVNLA